MPVLGGHYMPGPRSLEDAIRAGGKLIGIGKNNGIQVVKRTYKDGSFRMDSFSKEGKQVKHVERTSSNGRIKTAWYTRHHSGDVVRTADSFNNGRLEIKYETGTNTKDVPITQNQNWVKKWFNKLFNKKPKTKPVVTETTATISASENKHVSGRYSMTPDVRLNVKRCLSQDVETKAYKDSITRSAEKEGYVNGEHGREKRWLPADYNDSKELSDFPYITASSIDEAKNRLNKLVEIWSKKYLNS